MSSQLPKVGVDLLITKENKILLGLLTKKWTVNGTQVYGLPGRDLLFGEKMGDCVKRNVSKEFGCKVTNYKIICVNANYEWGNHYINIGILVEIEEEIKLLKPDDWEKWEWFEIEKLPQNLLVSAKNTIDCYLNNKICMAE